MNAVEIIVGKHVKFKELWYNWHAQRKKKPDGETSVWKSDPGSQNENVHMEKGQI